jgi:hypothetical protein
MEPRAPVLGLASIALPILMAALWLFFERNPHVGDGLTDISVGAGFFLGIAGLVRRERNRSLAVLGIIVNGVFLLLVFNR